MRRRLILAAGLILILAVAVLLRSVERSVEKEELSEPLALTISTPPVPMPAPHEISLDVSTELSSLPVQVCAGDAVRFRNRHTGPVILAASDFSFSSGVLQPREEFSVVLPAAGSLEIRIQSLGGGEMGLYLIEVVQCEG